MLLLKINLTGGPELIEELKSKPSRLVAVLSSKLTGLMFVLQSKIVGKLSGEVLKVRSGVLRASVHTIPVEVQAGKIIGSVESSGGPAMYGKFHEYGSRPHEIMAVKARALRFVMGGKVHFAKSVSHPGTMPKSFMASTLSEEAEGIKAALEESLRKVLEEK